MKYAVLIGDGMADYPIDALGGRTPLEAAATPNMDYIVAHGLIGEALTVPEGMPPGSDVANLCIFGYDPVQYYSGRAPFEAAGMGIKLHPDDVAFRLNLVTLSEDEPRRMLDYSAGHISSAEAAELIATLSANLSTEKLKFYPGVSYRHLLLFREGPAEAKTTPPHDITGREADAHLPQGSGREALLELMAKGAEILSRHPVNESRRKRGQSPATHIWLWGQGRAPQLPSFKERFNLQGGVISAVDLIKGIGAAAGLKAITVPGVTGYLDTNFRGKAEYALKALADADIIFVHVEAPDEAAHQGLLKEKIQAIEAFDAQVVGPVLMGLSVFGAYKILTLPDHPTPLALKTHIGAAVPFAMLSSNCSAQGSRANAAYRFNEESARKSEIKFPRGHKLLDFFLQEIDKK